MRRAFRASLGLSLLVCLFLGSTGCRQGTFIGDRYNNFRAYYNTFYNAKQAFETGEEALEQSERGIDRGRFISIFPAAQSTAQSSGGQFENAIEKSADLLRERPGSKWADDALLLIGKAYFYQNNFVGAEGKFRETISAALERDQPDLADEARVWLGRTLSASERFEEATIVLEEGLARTDIDKKWLSQMQLALGELYVNQREWSDAVEALRTGIPEAKDKDLAGRAQFLLGQVLEADGRYLEAATAYGDVSRYRPIYDLDYAAKLSQALVLGIDASQPEEALELIHRMRGDDKNFQNRGEVELAYARLLSAANRTREAEERFERLLYDEEFRANNVRGEVYYRYAEFFRDEVNDFVRASAYFDTAATNVRVEPAREELVTRVALRDVRRSAEVYRSYANIAGEVAEADSLLYLGSLSDEDFRLAIAEIERERRRVWEEEQRLLAQRRSEQGFGISTTTRPGETPVEDSGQGRTDFGAGGTSGIVAGFLNYRDPAREQDALLAFERVWGERQLAPNWRRLQALRSTAIVEGGPRAGEAGGQGSQTDATGPPALNLRNVPRTTDAQARLRSQRSELRYELGNVFFLSLALPDSAAHWYGLVIDEDFDEPVVTRARYALAEVFQTQDRMQEAEALYMEVIEEEPSSPQAAQARERLGMPPLLTDIDSDAGEVAEAEYTHAYDRWKAGAYREAIRLMLVLGASDADEDASPRALLAAGIIFQELASRDHLEVGRGIPGDLVPATLIEEARPFGGVGEMQEVEGAAIPEEPEEESTEEPEGENPEEPRRETEQQDPAAPGQVAPPQIDGEVPRERGEEMEAPPVVPEEPTLLADSANSVRVTPFGPPEDAGGLDTLLVLRDSTETRSQAAQSRADSVQTISAYLRLSTLYQIVEARYPGTEYASHAATRRAAFNAVLAPTGGNETAPADSVAVIVDPLAPLAQDVIDAAPVGTFGLGGDLPLNGEIGGFGWKVAAVPSPLAAQAMLRNFADRGLRSGAVREELDRRVLFMLILGQFASVDAAEAARSELPATGVGRDIEIVPILGFEFLDAEDLEQLRPD